VVSEPGRGTCVHVSIAAIGEQEAAAGRKNGRA